MQHDDLVRMLNQICDFFDAYPEDEAAMGVKEHLQKFWAPSMRKQMFDARQELRQRLHPLARTALELLAADATP